MVAEKLIAFRKDAGASVIEFVLVLPLLLLCLLGIWDFGQLIHHESKLNFLAREAGSRLFRDCITGIELPPGALPEPDRDRIKQCMERTATVLAGADLRDSPQVTILLSVYFTRDDTGDLDVLQVGTGEFTSRVTTTEVRNDPGLAKIVATGNLCVVEVVEEFDGILLSPRTLYEIGYV